MKICPRCKIEKNIEDYYKTSSYCKLCNKKYHKEHKIEIAAYNKEYRELNKIEIAAYNKEYRQLHKKEYALYYKLNKNEIAAYHKEYQYEHKTERAAISKKYSKKNPEKIKAHTILNYAIKKGTIIRLPCSICGSPKSEAHHEDYTKPLDVIWLCRTHHRARHNN